MSVIMAYGNNGHILLAYVNVSEVFRYSGQIYKANGNFDKTKN